MWSLDPEFSHNWSIALPRKGRTVRQIGFALCSVFLLTTPTLGAPPTWLADPANSLWLIFSGAGGASETNGLMLLPGGAEGENKPAVIDGVECVRTFRGKTAGGGCFYIKSVEPWEKLSAWLGSKNEILLTVRYHDGGKGTMRTPYDSSDSRVKHTHYPDGTWKMPPEWPNGIALVGDHKWKTARIRLPMAWFMNRCNGADLRIDTGAENFALAGAAITRMPKGEVEALLVKQDLRVARAVGCQPTGGGARFRGTFVQEKDEPLVMEAELATDLSLLGGQSPGSDNTASWGGFIHYVSSASWKFTLRTPGKYTMWERGSYPGPGCWSHGERMDSQGEIQIVDNTPDPHPAWKWVKAGIYDLKAGEHVFSLNYAAGARLDVLVLTNNGEKEPNLAARKSSYRGPVLGEVWTSAVKPFDVAKWKSVQFNLAMGKAVTTCEASVDGGQTWQPLDPAQGDLSSLATKGGGKDNLLFHLKFQGQAGSPPPLFCGGTVLYLAGPNNVKVVENSRLKVEIDPYGVKSVQDKKTGLFLCQAPPLHAAVAKLACKKAGPALLSSIDLFGGSVEDVRIEKKGEDTVRLVMRHLLDNAMRLTTSLTLLPSGQAEWQLMIENFTSEEVAEIQFPVLTGCKIGPSAKDDWIFMPQCWQHVWKNPGATGRLVTSPWGLAMRWTVLWDSAAGLYLGIEDPKWDDAGFLYGPDGSGGITLGAWQRILAKPHSVWKSAIYRMAVTAGDWHEAADIYRTYAAKTLKPCDIHPHAKWLLDAWSSQQSNDMPYRGWDVLHRTHDTNQELGIYFMSANRQMLDGADAGYCGLYPYPCLAWGSVEEFAQQLAALRARGGMYTPYHNFHLWSAGYGHGSRVNTFPRSRLPADASLPNDDWYRKAAAYSFEGAYQRLESEPFYTECPMAMGSKEWRQWLADWTRRYLAWAPMACTTTNSIWFTTTASSTRITPTPTETGPKPRWTSFRESRTHRGKKTPITQPPGRFATTSMASVWTCT